MSAQWDDLRPRILSAIVLLAIGGEAIWLGGPVFALVVVLATGVMMWELARMTTPGAAPDRALWIGALAAGMMAVNLWSPSPWSLPALVLPVGAGVLLPRRDRRVFFAYGLVIMATGLALVALRESLGLAPVVWLLAVIVASDVMGYFAGRTLGGPKFWPAVSPKKTWSGTVAGWLGAALVGLGFLMAGYGTAHLLWASPLVAFAGQMGDIAESWIKRRCGFKDSSNLIPGHGGVMDRFDALIGAAVMIMALGLVMPLPLPGG